MAAVGRLCLACAEKACPGGGGFTWAFGDCEVCGHFGITTPSEGPRELAKIMEQDDATDQQELFRSK